MSWTRCCRRFCSVDSKQASYSDYSGLEMDGQLGSKTWSLLASIPNQDNVDIRVRAAMLVAITLSHQRWPRGGSPLE
jgi:hypothetical protein